MSDSSFPTAPSTKRTAGRRTVLILCAISIGWKVLVLTVGTAVPRWVLTDGVAELPASHRAYAAASLVTARALYDKPVERFGRVVQQLRVVSVDSVAGDGLEALDGAASCAMGARVRAYTYFAIPYSEVRTRCGRGVIEYRMFRPRTRAE